MGTLHYLMKTKPTALRIARGVRAGLETLRRSARSSLLLPAMLAVPYGSAADQSNPATNTASLADLSVEQLMNEPVTSVARRETKFDESPAAISVITQDDLRRQGITTIPDALRLVPGLDVAQINDHEWAVSVRGFNNEFANKLLVLVDGRSVYGTGFGGVVWGAQDLVMEDVERIEVIRGPGASLWGANAVNGVINIITKSAKDTRGGLVSVAGGTIDQPMTEVRFGGQLATNLYGRVYGKFDNREGLVTGAGQEAPDRMLSGQGGFRLDWVPSEENTLTWQGDLYHIRNVENQAVSSWVAPYETSEDFVDNDSGANVLGRWTHDFSGQSSVTVQAYYDYFKQEQAGAADAANTFDLDAQHRFALGSRHDLTWGLGYREVEDDFTSSAFAGWDVTAAHNHLYSSFAQDEILLVPERLKLTLGSKLEHNDYTGFEVEPTGRLAWTPGEHQTIWAAVSRAVRTPAWNDLHADANLLLTPVPGTPGLMDFVSYGNPHLKSEDVIAYELGYRMELTKHLSLDVAGFYNDYDHLIAPSSVNTSFVGGAPSYLLVAATYENAGSADSYGVEVSARWDVTDHWHLMANYSWLEMQLGFDSPYLESGPAQQAQLRSALDLPWHCELNGVVSFVDQDTAPYSVSQMSIPSYVRLDVGVVWHATPNLELGVWGQNLTADQHVEFPSYKTLLVTEMPRSVVARLTWHF